MNLSKVSFILTNTCNAKCSFCYEGNPTSDVQLDPENAIKFAHIVNKLSKTLSWSLELIGGEPSLFENWDTIHNVVELLHPPKIIIFTNAKTLNIKMINFIRRYNDIVEVRIQRNTSNTLVVESIKRSGCKIFEHIIVDSEFITNRLSDVYDLSKSCALVLSEYRGFNDITYDDIIIYGEYVITNNLLSNNGLIYLNCLISGKRINSPTCVSCIPFYEEIAITPNGDIVPCSRWRNDQGITSIHVDKSVNEILSFITNQANTFSDIDSIWELEDGQNCLNCALYLYCNPCKMNLNDTRIIDGMLTKSLRKCCFERMKFSAQLELFKLWKETRCDEC